MRPPALPIAVCVAASLVAAAATPARAQQARPSVFAVESSAAVDETSDLDGNRVQNLTVDAVVSASLGRGFQAIVRPFAQRLGTGAWNRQVWVATVRYERRGPVGLRVEAGVIPSPIGLANLTLRPHLNATIAQPSSLFTPLPPLERPGARTVRATLLGAVYPYGVQATASGTHWDARAAAMDTSPLRTRRIFSPTNPPRFANVVVGGGVTPFVGFRVGASVTHGAWQHDGESPSITEDRRATIVTIKSDLAFRYTKLAGEWTRDGIETSTGGRVASGWFVQGQQTLSAHWFVAGRAERMQAPAVFWLDGSQTPLESPLVVKQRLSGVEETLGYRITPELTLRTGHRARKEFGRDGFVHTFSVSAVWWRRWL